MRKTDTKPCPTSIARRVLGWLRAAGAAALLTWTSSALAHATLVLGTLETTPDPPVPGEALALRIRLEDPGLVAIEDAHVRVEFRERGAAVPGAADEDAAEAPLLRSDPFEETDAGQYVGTVTAPPAGTYTLSVRDTTFRQEEAIANVQLTIGAEEVGAVPFVLPPTATGPRSALTWVLWLVGVPLAAGVLVTVLVLRSGPREHPHEDAA